LSAHLNSESPKLGRHRGGALDGVWLSEVIGLEILSSKLENLFVILYPMVVVVMRTPARFKYERRAKGLRRPQFPCRAPTMARWQDGKAEENGHHVHGQVASLAAASKRLTSWVYELIRGKPAQSRFERDGDVQMPFRSTPRQRRQRSTKALKRPPLALRGAFLNSRLVDVVLTRRKLQNTSTMQTRK
jgi:hypothetical protein